MLEYKGTAAYTFVFWIQTDPVVNPFLPGWVFSSHG
jgi:hypothetical protein